MARVCKDFHIRGSLKILITCVHDEVPSPLSWDSTHVAMLFARAIMFYIIPPLVMRRKSLILIIAINAILQQQWMIFSSRFKNAFCYISLSDRSQFDCAHVRIRIFTGRGGLNIPFRECESAHRFHETICISACTYICVCVCIYMYGITQSLAKKTLDTGINYSSFVCNSDAIFLTTRAWHTLSKHRNITTSCRITRICVLIFLWFR